MKKMDNFTLVILVAGMSKRFGSKTKKQFILVDNKPIFIHTVNNLIKHEFCDVVIVSSECDLGIVKKYIQDEDLNTLYPNTKIHYVVGGDERVYSVYNACEYLKNNTQTKYIFIHDGVRPLVSKSEIDNLKQNVENHNASILAIKVVDTIKSVSENKMITNTIDRTNLYRACTPQAFNFSFYYEAMSRYIKEIDVNQIATDDAEIYSKYIGNVFITECSIKNIKITEKKDLDIYKHLQYVKVPNEMPSHRRCTE